MHQVPVLIAGGGPVGMTLACELAARDIPCLLAERNHATTVHPKMDITNARSMELFRRLGLTPALRAVAVPESSNFDVAWVTTMAGHELHRFRYPSVTEARQRIRAQNDGTQPAEPPMRVSQVEIEPVLKQAIDAAPQVDVRFGLAFESLTQDADGVTAALRTDTGILEQVRCQYLIGCDGGGSAVRQNLNIPLSGESRIMPRFMTHFRSEARSILQRFGIAWHYQSLHGTLIAQNDHDLWTLHTRMPEGQDDALPDPATLLKDFLGADIPHQVLVANRWSPHLLVADSYGKGRVFLAGDAAHQYIPTGGYGMNTGIGDACDLGWKMAAVLRGFGGPGLLSGYEHERRPVGLRNREASRAHNATRARIAQVYRDTPEDLAGMAARIAAIGNAENESAGIELGYNYAGSPLVSADSEQAPPDDPLRYVPSTVPGVRLPSVCLAEGGLLHDRLGKWFTLLAFEVAPSQTLLSAASQFGMPLDVVRLNDPELLAIYGRQQILVRPDQHIAWRGGDAPAHQASRIIGGSLGHA